MFCLARTFWMTFHFIVHTYLVSFKYGSEIKQVEKSCIMSCIFKSRKEENAEFTSVFGYICHFWRLPLCLGCGHTWARCQGRELPGRSRYHHHPGLLSCHPDHLHSPPGQQFPPTNLSRSPTPWTSSHQSLKFLLHLIILYFFDKGGRIRAFDCIFCGSGTMIFL